MKLLTFIVIIVLNRTLCAEPEYAGVKSFARSFSDPVDPDFSSSAIVNPAAIERSKRCNEDEECQVAGFFLKGHYTTETGEVISKIVKISKTPKNENGSSGVLQALKVIEGQNLDNGITFGTQFETLLPNLYYGTMVMTRLHSIVRGGVLPILDFDMRFKLHNSLSYNRELLSGFYIGYSVRAYYLVLQNVHGDAIELYEDLDSLNPKLALKEGVGFGDDVALLWNVEQLTLSGGIYDVGGTTHRPTKTLNKQGKAPEMVEPSYFAASQYRFILNSDTFLDAYYAYRLEGYDPINHSGTHHYGLSEQFSNRLSIHLGYAALRGTGGVTWSFCQSCQLDYSVTLPQTSQRSDQNRTKLHMIQLSYNPL